MCYAETQAAALAALLSAALGAEPRLEAAAGRIRIEVDLPEELAPGAHAAILNALSAGARYGHERNRHRLGRDRRRRRDRRRPSE
ncbi:MULTISPECIES: hypothetical protein [unclassified Streptomyces]|uniref:hypothetical protein n=1 Tax=unclassified Streptomyces TaxID=2593676 RepID=UPI001BE93C56|nr:MULTISPECIES: hypothetical protein [unclassified Streptomyces]MBT2403391.1 hypothetical protein [Streptomyces sp. ISL-21]MBT2456868.1 hypothetical protein [Streptomyces sp. ISL-86]MBT2606922.1 hypothetical protein [Streptomyces sp. ISL-87]